MLWFEDTWYCAQNLTISWMCTQGSLLPAFRGPYGVPEMETGSARCKANTVSDVLSVQSLPPSQEGHSDPGVLKSRAEAPPYLGFLSARRCPGPRLLPFGPPICWGYTGSPAPGKQKQFQIYAQGSLCLHSPKSPWGPLCLRDPITTLRHSQLCSASFRSPFGLASAPHSPLPAALSTVWRLSYHLKGALGRRGSPMSGHRAAFRAAAKTPHPRGELCVDC